MVRWCGVLLMACAIGTPAVAATSPAEVQAKLDSLNEREQRLIEKLEALRERERYVEKQLETLRQHKQALIGKQVRSLQRSPTPASTPAP